MTNPAPTQLLQQGLDINVRQYLGVLWRRKWLFLQVFVVVLGVGIATTASHTPSYRTQAKFLVPTPTYSLSITDSNNPISSILQVNQPDTVETQLEVLNSEPFISEVMAATGIKSRPGVTPPSVRVDALGDASVIVVSVDGGDPKEIRVVADKMIELHQKRMSERDQAGLKQAIEFVRARKQEAERDLNRAKATLAAYLVTAKVAQRAADRTELSQRYIDLRGRLTGLESTIASTAGEMRRLKTELASAPVKVEKLDAKENPRRPALQTRLDELSMKREESLANFKPESAEIRALDRAIARLQTALANEPERLESKSIVANPRRTELEQRLAKLEAEHWNQGRERDAQGKHVATLEEMLISAVPVESRQAELNAERDRLQATYFELTNRLRDLELRQIARVPTSRTIQQAYDGRLVQPRGQATLLLTTMLALAVAAGLALLQEMLDDRINSPSDVEPVTNLSALAHVPLLGREQSRLVSELPSNSQVGEAYRSLRSSIGFAALDAPIRRILVTSASKGEGKSVTSVNLATIMALDGKRVVLVDADLRKPSIHHLLNLSNERGFSEVLGGLVRLEDAIQETSVENLSVICAGPVPPNPAELLGSRTFDDIVDRLEEEADVVIFDSPPCIPVTDPLIVAARMDGVVLVVHVGQTRKGAIRQVEQLLGRARARMLGLVFNRVQFGRANYAYYYGYGYGYYGQERGRNGRSAKNLIERELGGDAPVGSGRER